MCTMRFRLCFDRGGRSGHFLEIGLLNCNLLRRGGSLGKSGRIYPRRALAKRAGKHLVEANVGAQCVVASGLLALRAAAGGDDHCKHDCQDARRF